MLTIKFDFLITPIPIQQSFRFTLETVSTNIQKIQNSYYKIDMNGRIFTRRRAIESETKLYKNKLSNKQKKKETSIFNADC